MITTLPAVQFGCKRAHRYINYGGPRKRWDKRNANRRHRRALNRITHTFVHDPERFEGEGFNTPSLSPWDIY